jgi:hypothetical protein
MIEIAGASFPLRWREGPGREIALLGVVPVGAIERLPTGRWCWSLDLPLIRRARMVSDQAAARERLVHALTQWLEATGCSEARAPVRNERRA